MAARVEPSSLVERWPPPKTRERVPAFPASPAHKEKYFFGFLARVVERGTFFGPMDAEPVMAESEAKQAQEPDTAAEGDEAVDAEAKELVFLKKVTLSARHARWSGLILNGMLAARWRCRLRAW